MTDARRTARGLVGGRESAAALAASGTGASTAGMLACCAHHVTDVAPLLGLSGATVFLSDYRLAFMVVGLAVNGVGVAVMLRLLRREARAGPRLAGAAQ